MAAALAVVVASGLLTSAGRVSAQPADTASTLSTTCGVFTNTARTVYSVACDSSWPWENFIYQAWVQCTDGNTYYGLAWRSYWDDGRWSVARCESGHYTRAGYYTWDAPSP